MKHILHALLLGSVLVAGTMQASKFICTVGLEGEGSFTEVYKTKKDCQKYCRGGATICEETGDDTPVNLGEVD